MRKASIGTGLAILFLGFLFLLGATQAAGAAEKTKIRLGHIVHMTGAYAAGQYGHNEGYLDAVEAMNKYGNMKDAELVGLWMDGATDTARSMNVFKQFTEGKESVVVICGESTPVGLAIKASCLKKKVPDVEGGNDDELFHLPSWTFCVTTPYTNQLGAWVDYYLEKIWKNKGQNRAPRFAWLTWDSAFGRASITDKTKEYVKSKGVEIVGEEFIPMTPTDVSAQILRLKEKQVDFVFGAMYHTALAVVLQEMDKQGLIDKIDYGMSYAMLSDALLPLLKGQDLARNVYQTHVSYIDEENLRKRAPRVMEMYDKNDRKKFPLVSYILGWKQIVACEAVRLAVEQVGAKKVDGTAVYNALQKMKFDYWGLGPGLTYTAKKRYGQDGVIMYRLNNLKLNALTEFPSPNLTKYDWK